MMPRFEPGAFFLTTRLRVFRGAAFGVGLTAMLASGTVFSPGQAVADSGFVPTVSNLYLEPGYTGYPADPPLTGSPEGTYVYAFSKQPLTDPSWAAGGLPEWLTVDPPSYACVAYPDVPGVFTCPVARGEHGQPPVYAHKDAVNGATVYEGVAFAPAGSDVGVAVKAAQVAGTTSDPARPSAAVVQIKTPEQLAKSTVRLSTPNVPVNSSAVQTVQVHAEDAGVLALSFRSTPDERKWDSTEVDIHVTSVDGGPAGTCSPSAYSIASVEDAVTCDLPVGDHTVSYTLTTGAKVAAWKVGVDAEYRIAWSAYNPKSASTFAVASPYPVRERYDLYARRSNGQLYRYLGTGNGAAPYQASTLYDFGWDQYSALTALSPLTVHETGDVVARDTRGILWYFRGTGSPYDTRTRTRVGSGWNIYPTLVGAGDLNGDGKADLVAKDSPGVLWLYKGTGNMTGQLATRTRICAGWNIYNTLTGAGDLTGDGKADLVGRDASGVLWLYKGTGNATAPYANRTRIGGGWNVYNTLI